MAGCRKSLRGSRDACLDCMLSGIQVTTGLEVSLYPFSSCTCNFEDCDSLL